jgi:hypothetical protein
MDYGIVALSTVVVLGVTAYLFASSQIDFLKDNWAEYRCNPIYMPLAGLVGESVSANFTKCTMKGFQDYAGYMMDPIMGEFAIVNETIGEVGGTLRDMRSMMSTTRNGFLGVVGSVFGKIQNTMSSVQYIIIRMRTLMSRIVGVMMSFMMIFHTGMQAGNSVVNGPIYKVISAL